MVKPWSAGDTLPERTKLCQPLAQFVSGNHAVCGWTDSIIEAVRALGVVEEEDAR